MDDGGAGGQERDQRPRAVNLQNPMAAAVASLLLLRLRLFLLYLLLLLLFLLLLGAANAGGGRHVGLSACLLFLLYF